jgi:hypothetical protein
MMNASMDQSGSRVVTAQDAIQNELDRQYTVYITLAAATLYVFDYLLTLEAEKKYLWRGRHGLATILFFLIRYPPLLIFALNIYFLPFNPTANTNFTQDALWYLRFSLTGWVAGCGGGILVIRTYALYAENKKHLLITIPAMIAPMAFLALAALDSTVPMEETVPVLAGSSTAQSLFGNSTATQQVISTCNDGDVIMPCAASVGFDVVIFALTVARRLYYRRQEVSLVGVMVRDGALYFLSLVLANVITLLLVVRNPTDASAWAVVQVSSLLTVLLISRLFLNLRIAAHHSRQPDHNSTFREVTTLSLDFASRTQIMSDDNEPTLKAPKDTGTGRFFGTRTFKEMIGLDDFRVDLPGLDTFLLFPEDDETGDSETDMASEKTRAEYEV